MMILNKMTRPVPTMLNYFTHVDKRFYVQYTTSCAYIFSLRESSLDKENGGVKAMDKLAKQRAELLYGEIDRNKLFRGTVEEADRSLMNICL